MVQPKHVIRWEKVRKLGEGGQGEVYCVRDKQKCKPREEIRDKVADLVFQLGSNTSREDQREKRATALVEEVINIWESQNPENYAALKILRETGAKNSKMAPERIAREMRVMANVEHPNLLKTIESNSEEFWFVSEFHPNGTLDQIEGRFAGDVPGALRMLRPIVAGVAELHRNKIVHRDIKPHNVFMSTAHEPVLGDFGLVFFEEADRTRVTESFENVGTWQWMPTWAQDMRVEDVKPAFDVFSLGKMLWWMVSGLPVNKLRLWYFNSPQYSQLNVEKLFPEKRFIDLVNPLLQKCVVEHASESLDDATEMLKEIDYCLEVIQSNAASMREGVMRRCQVCGVGEYKLVADPRRHHEAHNFGLSGIQPVFNIFHSLKCGHVQLFKPT